MYETMIVTILVASMSGLIKENGGFESILQFIKRNFKGSSCLLYTSRLTVPAI